MFEVIVKMLRTVVTLCLLGLVACGPPVSRSREEIEKFRDFLESTTSENGRRISLPSENPKANIWENSGKYQGDILLDEDQIQTMVEQFSSGRNAYIFPNTRWPQNTVVYEFAAGHFDAAQINHILYTMSVIERFTCIRFRQRRAGEFNYALITGHTDGCYASVGYWASRGVHTMNVARDRPGFGCLDTIVVIHEWFHVIGFFHMQSTYDRDTYVRINWANIWPGMEHNFDRLGSDLVSNMGLPYEHNSCMHYGPYGFSINGRSTMDNLWGPNSEMGTMNMVTGYDFLRVNRHAGCAWRAEDQLKDFFYDAATMKETVVDSKPVETVADDETAVADDKAPLV